MREHPIAQKAREKVRSYETHEKNSLALTLCEAADALDWQRAYIQKLERRIHNQRANGRITWEIVEMRCKWMGSKVARDAYHRLVKRYRRLLHKYEGYQFAEHMMSEE